MKFFNNMGCRIKLGLNFKRELVPDSSSVKDLRCNWKLSSELEPELILDLI